MAKQPAKAQSVKPKADETEEKEDEVQQAVAVKHKRYPGNWIKCTPEQLQEWQAQGKVMGFCNKTHEVLLNEEE